MMPTKGPTPKNQKLWDLFTNIGRLQTHWKWLGRILSLVAILFVVLIFINNWSHLQQVNWEAYLVAVLISIFIYLASLLLQLFVWLRMLAAHHPIGFQDVKIYMQTVMLRQIPGGFWHWLGRSSMYQANKTLSSKLILSANFIDWILIVITAFGIYGLFAINTHFAIRITLILLTLGFCIGAAFYWLPPKIWYLNLLEGVVWTTAYLGSWFLGGLLLFVLLRVETSTPVPLFNAILIWAVAGGISAIAIISPSGLGIREISLTVLLQPYMPVAQSILVALILRLTFMASDIIWGGCGWGLGRFILYKQQDNKKDSFSTEI